MGASKSTAKIYTHHKKGSVFSFYLLSKCVCLHVCIYVYKCGICFVYVCVHVRACMCGMFTCVCMYVCTHVVCIYLCAGVCG